MKVHHIASLILIFTLTFSPVLTHAKSIIGGNKTYYKIIISGEKTHVNEARDLSFLLPVEPEMLEPQEISYINYWVRQDLNIRTEPSKDGKKLGVIPVGEKISIATLPEGEDDSWIPVKWNEVEGYVAKKYLSETEYFPIPLKSDVLPNHIYVMGKYFQYLNGGKEFGQAIIDNDSTMVSTWGGAGVWSGSDDMNTHFIAHSSGAFAGLWDTTEGERIMVTDETMNATEYIVVEKFLVDDYGNKDGENYFDYIAGKSGGEIITLQTCETEETNWIIRAEKIE